MLVIDPKDSMLVLFEWYNSVLEIRDNFSFEKIHISPKVVQFFHWCIFISVSNLVRKKIRKLFLLEEHLRLLNCLEPHELILGFKHWNFCWAIIAELVFKFFDYSFTKIQLKVKKVARNVHADSYITNRCVVLHYHQSYIYIYIYKMVPSKRKMIWYSF